MNQIIVDMLAFNAAGVFYVFLHVGVLAVVVAVYSFLFSRWWNL